MNIYYEMSKYSDITSIGKYIVEHNTFVNGGGASYSLQLMLNADRAWAEDDKHVWFMKNRLGLTKPDLEEFLWIKLKCKPYR